MTKNPIQLNQIKINIAQISNKINKESEANRLKKVKNL